MIGSAIRERLSEFYGWSSGSLLFVNKKKQKNFVTWSAPAVVGALQVIKVFCFFFSKKDASSLPYRDLPRLRFLRLRQCQR